MVHSSCVMKLFLDSASLDQIREAADLGYVDGITTNAILMAAEGIANREEAFMHYKTICSLIDGDVSARVVSEDAEGIVREGRELSDLHTNLLPKIPLTREGLKAIKQLSKEGIRTNCTVIFSVPQAILAAKVGATYVSVFVGKTDDTGGDGLALIADVAHAFDTYGYASQILAASIRSIDHVAGCARLGADALTCPLELLRNLAKHPLTDEVLARFSQADCR